jgi:phosphoserine phosphatase
MIKLIFFDMEGTLYKEYKATKNKIAVGVWTLLAERLGKKALDEENKTKEKWKSGKYRDYIEWMEASLNVHKKYGLKKEFFERIINSVKYHNGVKETFKELRKKRYKTALISGGFKALADRAQKDLKIDHSFSACEHFWDTNGNLLHWNLLPCNNEGKADFMNLMRKEYGLKKKECAFVGDCTNDISLAKSVGVSIAFNAHPDLQKVCTYSINQPEGKEDFRAILKYIK